METRPRSRRLSFKSFESVQAKPVMTVMTVIVPLLGKIEKGKMKIQLGGWIAVIPVIAGREEEKRAGFAREVAPGSVSSPHSKRTAAVLASTIERVAASVERNDPDTSRSPREDIALSKTGAELGAPGQEFEAISRKRTNGAAKRPRRPCGQPRCKGCVAAARRQRRSRISQRSSLSIRKWHATHTFSTTYAQLSS